MLREVSVPLSSMSMSLTTGDKVFAFWYGTFEPAILLDCVSPGTDVVNVLWWMEFSRSSLPIENLRLTIPIEHDVRVVARWRGEYHPGVVWAPRGCNGVATITVRWDKEFSMGTASSNMREQRPKT